MFYLYVNDFLYNFPNGNTKKNLEVSSDSFRLEMMVVVNINNSELRECPGCCSSQISHFRSIPENMNSTKIVL